MRVIPWVILALGVAVSVTLVWRNRTEPDAPMRPRTIVGPITWQGQAIPRREWIVPAFIPKGDVTLLSGNGGIGKSLAVMMLLTAAATGKTWFGQTVMPCKAFGLFCEDSGAELARRQDAINRHFGIEFGDLESLQWDVGHGHDRRVVMGL